MRVLNLIRRSIAISSRTSNLGNVKLRKMIGKQLTGVNESDEKNSSEKGGSEHFFPTSLSLTTRPS